MPAERRTDSTQVPSLEAVLFDMDGLLVDTEHAWGAAEVEVMTWLGHPYWSEEEQGADARWPALARWRRT